MSIKRPGHQFGIKSALAAHVGPLGEAELMQVRVGMAEIAPDWTVELHGICADVATLVLLPDDGDDAKGPSFVISRETYGLRLDQVHWDTMTEVGVYRSISDILAVLRLRLAFAIPAAPLPAVTLH